MSGFGARAEAARRRLLGPGLCLWLWKTLPLAACAGLKVVRLDEESCAVRIPGGWRTRDPFRSTYFAAEAMAAEMSTGAPALVAAQDVAGSVATLVVGLQASYTKKLVGPGVFTFEDVAGMRAAIAAAAASDEPRTFRARSVGRDREGSVVAEFEIAWSFKRRSRP